MQPVTKSQERKENTSECFSNCRPHFATHNVAGKLPLNCVSHADPIFDFFDDIFAKPQQTQSLLELLLLQLEHDGDDFGESAQYLHTKLLGHMGDKHQLWITEKEPSV